MHPSPRPALAEHVAAALAVAALAALVVLILTCAALANGIEVPA